LDPGGRWIVWIPFFFARGIPHGASRARSPCALSADSLHARVMTALSTGSVLAVRRGIFRSSVNELRLARELLSGLAAANVAVSLMNQPVFQQTPEETIHACHDRAGRPIGGPA
jgi:hypothetical protein